MVTAATEGVHRSGSATTGRFFAGRLAGRSRRARLLRHMRSTARPLACFELNTHSEDTLARLRQGQRMASKPPDAFLSYTRFDDRRGDIRRFCEHLEDAVREVTGEPFEIFQDVDDIEVGERWSDKLDEMLAETRFFIPILTPSYFNSAACRDELQKFLRAEEKAGRRDLILPIYYIRCPVLEDKELRRADDLATAIHQRQRWEWRELRHYSFRSRNVRLKIEALGEAIATARHTRMPRRGATAAKSGAADEEKRSQVGVLADAARAAKRARRKVEEETAAERQPDEEERERAEAERRVKEEQARQRAEEAARRRAAEEQRRRAEEAESKRQAEEETRERTARRHAAEQAAGAPSEPDIFLSYAREDEARARDLATALEQRGFVVFWDREVPPGGTWHSHIVQALLNARCVVVAWSRYSMLSDWVIEEASEAQLRNLLVPVLFEAVEPPRGFRAIQAASLIDWRPGQSSPGFDDLLGAVQRIVGGRQPALPPRCRIRARHFPELCTRGRGSRPRPGNGARGARVVRVLRPEDTAGPDLAQLHRRGPGQRPMRHSRVVQPFHRLGLGDGGSGRG